MRFIIPGWLLAVMALLFLFAGMVIWRRVHISLEHKRMRMEAKIRRGRNHALDHYLNRMHPQGSY